MLNKIRAKIKIMNLFVFLFGLMVGSFLNCVIYRIEKGESFLKGRSYCPHCKHKLGFCDLIPVLSFIWLKGRCRYCGKKISIQYPLVELATGALFVLFLNIRFPQHGMLSGETFHVNEEIGYLVFIPFLVIIFVYDLKHYIIPDKVVFSAITVAAIYNLIRLSGEDSPLQIWRGLSSPAFSAFGAAAFFLAIVLISRGKWMGVGDIKLAFLMGLILGWPNISVALFLAFLIGAIIGVGLMVFGKKTIKSEVPFGPFLVGGTLIALFFGKEIINWYVQSFYFN